jgi:hypothetical protein
MSLKFFSGRTEMWNIFIASDSPATNTAAQPFAGADHCTPRKILAQILTKDILLALRVKITFRATAFDFFER